MLSLLTLFSTREGGVTRARDSYVCWTAKCARCTLAAASAAWAAVSRWMLHKPTAACADTTRPAYSQELTQPAHIAVQLLATRPLISWEKHRHCSNTNCTAHNPTQYINTTALTPVDCCCCCCCAAADACNAAGRWGCGPTHATPMLPLLCCCCHRAVQPPSMEMHAPVMLAELGPHRCTTIAARSSGFTNCFVGWSASSTFSTTWRMQGKTQRTQGRAQHV
jgi:hypothetical protein